MPKIFTSKTQQIGEIGENIACTFLMKHGFEIIERNYTKKWGEIDIIAKKEGKLYFIEVKAVSRLLKGQNGEVIDNIEKEIDRYRPEDNLHPWKQKRLKRVIQSYLLQRHIPDDIVWQFDLLCVYMDQVNRVARVKVVEDLIL